jgi:nitrilase
MLVDPWGTVVDVRAEGEGLVIGDLEPERLADVRRKLPALAHRTLAPT